MTTDATLTERVLMPVASDTDARTTCRALRSYSPNQVIAIHIIEKAGGAPDKAGVEQRRNNAQSIFTAVDDVFETTKTAVETEIRYGTAIAQAIVDAANEHSASAIVFSPRRGGRWVRLLTGDVALSLLTESNRPVIVLPGELDETVSDGSVAVSESASTDTGRTARIDADERDAADSAENDENSDS
jgi:nucleotide-binding universal stress UspA family protein